jgi:hypothetical protein
MQDMLIAFKRYNICRAATYVLRIEHKRLARVLRSLPMVSSLLELGNRQQTSCLANLAFEFVHL